MQRYRQQTEEIIKNKELKHLIYHKAATITDKMFILRDTR